MASLVAVCRSDDYPFERRQIPLAVDDNLTMVMQFSDTCLGCNHGGIKQKELERFVQKFHALSKDEVAVALMVTSKDIFSMLSQMVPCLGCRRSVERLFNELVQTGYPALEPLIITKNSILSIRREYLFDPKAIYALFYVHGSKLNTVMESIPKSKKNKRCVLHSLDTHKTKSLGSWIDVWDVLSHDCREEVMLIDCESFMDTLDNYLRKHRFCSECKSKVQRAYNILVGEVVGNNEKGYCPALYEGLRCCPSEKHFHVMCDTPFIANIIGRAEPELTGRSRRERHAKTLDIAQEEVLTCLGIHLYERLHRIWQKLRAEEQTWQLLFYLGVDALRKNFEVALEKKQGISNLELMCQELLEEEQAKEQRREQKRQKKKKKKNKSKQDIEQELPEKENDNCKWDENTNLNTTSCASCDDHNCNMLTTSSNQTSAPEPCDVLVCDCGGDQQSSKDSGSSGSRSDCGYSSGLDSCELCSMPSSGDGSDVACSEPLCNHDGDGMLCNQIVLPDVCHVCLESSQSQRHSAKNSRKRGGGKCHDRGGGKCHGSVPTSVSNGLPARPSAPLSMAPSLQDMLEDSYSSGEEESMISEEEIQKFKANQKSLNSQRQELREMLRQRFANLQKRGCLCAHGKPQQQPCGPAHACIHLTHVSKHVGKLSLN